MSGNYYYITSKKRLCGSCHKYHIDDNPYIFIGRDEPGYAFRLYGSLDIPDLDAWKLKWEVPETLIIDGSDNPVSPIDMLTIITLRHGLNIAERANYEPGAHGLLRRLIGTMIGDHTCERNEDTYDLFAKED